MGLEPCSCWKSIFTCIFYFIPHPVHATSRARILCSPRRVNSDICQKLRGEKGNKWMSVSFLVIAIASWNYIAGRVLKDFPLCFNPLSTWKETTQIPMARILNVGWGVEMAMQLEWVRIWKVLLGVSVMLEEIYPFRHGPSHLPSLPPFPASAQIIGLEQPSHLQIRK